MIAAASLCPAMSSGTPSRASRALLRDVSADANQIIADADLVGLLWLDLLADGVDPLELDPARVLDGLDLDVERLAVDVLEGEHALALERGRGAMAGHVALVVLHGDVEVAVLETAVLGVEHGAGLIEAIVLEIGGSLLGQRLCLVGRRPVAGESRRPGQAERDEHEKQKSLHRMIPSLRMSTARPVTGADHRCVGTSTRSRVPSLPR